MSTGGPAANFARAAVSFITSTGTTPRSKGAPELASLISSGVPAKRSTSLWPVAPSKRGPSSFRLAAFERAVEEVADVARRLLASLHTSAPARDRDLEAEKARARAKERYA